MKNEDVKQLVEIRNFVISAHNSLYGRNEPAAMIKESDVAYTLSDIIKKIDNMLQGYVHFEEVGQ